MLYDSTVILHIRNGLLECLQNLYLREEKIWGIWDSDLIEGVALQALKTFHAKCDNQRCMDINTWREFLRFSGLRLNPEVQ
jgi:hypothetical protein